MYEAYYGFREKPFALSPDPKFLYLSQSHREVLGHLVYGIQEGEGFMAISGEVGTGKTTLCRTLLERLDHCDIAFLFNPTLTPTDLVKNINSEFDLSTFGDSRAELIDVLNTHLLERHAEDRRVLVIIDEAQNLPDETLEQLRLLGNLESQTRKLLQILLIGQPELDRKLEATPLRQLRQRISVWWRLDALSAEETAGYVRHRLRVASGGDRSYFTDAALEQIHQSSGGVPRAVNVLADRSLLAGFGAELEEIPATLVKDVADELRSRPTPRQIRRRAVRFGVGGAVAAGSAALLLASVLYPLARPAPGVASLVPPPAHAEVQSPPPTVRPVEPPPVAARPPVRPAAKRRVTPSKPPPPIALHAQDSETRLRPGRGRLDRLLRDLTPAQARSDSLAVLLRAWGHDVPIPDASPRSEVAEILESLGLEKVELTGLHELIAYDLPAILPLATSSGEARSALVLAIEGESAVLDGIVPGQLVEIPLEVLRLRWVPPVWTVRAADGVTRAPRLHRDPTAQAAAPSPVPSGAARR